MFLKLTLPALLLALSPVFSNGGDLKPAGDTPPVELTAGDFAHAVRADAKFFANELCSALPTDFKQENLTTLRTPVMRALAEALLAGKTKREYLLAEYEAYASPEALGRDLKLGSGFSRYENMTGVFLEKGRAVIFVKNAGNKKVSLLIPFFMRMPAPGIVPTKDPNGWGLHKKEIPLRDGLNIVNVEREGNAYISYFDPHPETAPKIAVHFVGAKVNGYFDARIHTNRDWNRLLDEAVSPIMDARGEHIQVAYPVDYFKKFAFDHGKELIENYDKILHHHYTLLGLVKYNKVPKNRILTRVNFNYYMFRDGDGVAYLGNNGTMRMVVRPESVIKGDPCWGFSHEAGHVLQMKPQTTWAGMGEVSNNIFSLYTTTALGNKSRLSAQKNYASARKNIIEATPKKSLLHAADVFDRLVPFWQLQLYFAKHGTPDFYPDLMESMRNRPDVGTGNASIKNMVEFTKLACDAGKTDLTEFFDKWGFFYVGEIEVGDYGGPYKFEITQAMVDEAKNYIKAKNYPKPAEDLTRIED